MQEECRRFCATRGLEDCVTFLGQIDWIPRLFGEADIVVVPSEWEEAFGFVAVEAMASGACVLGSDAGAIPEVIGRDGTSGRIFRRGDADDLARQLNMLLHDPQLRASMGGAARQRVERMFTLERMVAAYMTVYEELATGSLG